MWGYCCTASNTLNSIVKSDDSDTNYTIVDADMISCTPIIVAAVNGTVSHFESSGPFN